MNCECLSSAPRARYWAEMIVCPVRISFGITIENEDVDCQIHVHTNSSSSIDWKIFPIVICRFCSRRIFTFAEKMYKIFLYWYLVSSLTHIIVTNYVRTAQDEAKKNKCERAMIYCRWFHHFSDRQHCSIFFLFSSTDFDIRYSMCVWALSNWKASQDKQNFVRDCYLYTEKFCACQWELKYFQCWNFSCLCSLLWYSTQFVFDEKLLFFAWEKIILTNLFASKFFNFFFHFMQIDTLLVFSC